MEEEVEGYQEQRLREASQHDAQERKPPRARAHVKLTEGCGRKGRRQHR